MKTPPPPVFEKRSANALLEKLANVIQDCKSCSIITQDMVYAIVNAEYKEYKEYKESKNSTKMSTSDAKPE